MNVFGKILTRLAVCAFFAAPMWVVWITASRSLALFGFVAAVTVYVTIQACTHFSHPLHGALTVVVLALLYAFLAPAMAGGRHQGPTSPRA